MDIVTFDGFRPRQEVYVGSGPSYRGFQWFHNLQAIEDEWPWPLTSDRLPAHHPLRRRPPWNHRDAIKFGPRMWILEFRRRGAIPLTSIYPRYTLWTPRGWTIPHQLDIAVWNLWPQFTALEHQLPRPGYDFGALVDHINTLPDWATPTAWTPTHRPTTTATGRRARRTQPRGNR